MKIATSPASERTLRRWLAALFLAFAVPTAFLAWQSWSQLEYEAFYNHALQAESLTRSIDRELADTARRFDELNVGDFVYGTVSTGPEGRVIDRSPLANVPVSGPVDAILGYFEIDEDGVLGSPLLPDDGTLAVAGLSDAETEARRRTFEELRNILTANRLIPGTQSSADDPDTGAADEATVSQDAELVLAEDARTASGSSRAPRSPAPSTAAREEQASAFQQLLRSAAPIEAYDAPIAEAEAPAKEADASLGRLQDLRLDTTLQKKSEVADRLIASSNEAANQPVAPATVAPRERFEGRRQEPVSAFGGDVERFRFGLLESGHAVLFRNAVRNGARVVQGALLQRERLLDDTLVGSFENSSLAGTSDFVIAFGDEILRIARSDDAARYPAGSASLAGSLLHRTRLSPPFENIELVFSVRRLPPGPAAGVLAWTAILIAVVLIAGFMGLYRLGVGQIRLARQQQDFVSAISHELKTPLTSIRMYGEMLREGWPDEDRRRQYYEFIHEESERLSRLIDNVLQLARISRQAPDLDLTSMPIPALRDLVESKLADSVRRAGFELRIWQDPSIGDRSVRLDPDSFLQIAINLVDNALKFSSSADRQVIECAIRPGRDDAVVFAIRDYGPGIPKAQLKRIFGLFYRPRSELTRETVGTGIGLSIVKTLAERMGGSVDVVNTQPGAEFRVTFPLEAST